MIIKWKARGVGVEDHGTLIRIAGLGVRAEIPTWIRQNNEAEMLITTP